MPLTTVLAIGLIGGSTTVAQAKPKQQVVYPVKVTNQIKTTEYPPGSQWAKELPNVPAIVTYGRITSPNRACIRHRSIIGLYTHPGFGTEENRETGIVSTATGTWEGEVIPDLLFPAPGSISFREAIRTGQLEVRGKVARKRLGKGRVCAEAISAYLKA
jgi:hypothetical protein